MTEGLESLGKIRIQGVLLLVVAFAAGGLAGVAGERIRASRAAPAPPPERPFGGGRLGAGQDEFLPRAYERLDLTAEQQRAVRAVFARARPVIDSMFAQTVPRTRAIMDSVHAEVRALLTPEQRERLDAVMTRRGRRPDLPRGMRPGGRPPDRPRP